MSRTAVDKGGKYEDRNEFGGYGEDKLKGIGKSGSVEDNSFDHMERFNATFRPCEVRKVARYFFESEDSAVVSGLVALAFALAALEEDFGQSLAEWPCPPQKRQR